LNKQNSEDSLVNAWNLLDSLQGATEALTFDEASAELRAKLATGPKVRMIGLVLDQTNGEVSPWLASVKVATPEIRGLMVQRFFARMLCKAGYEVIVGSKLDIFARGRLRSLFIEVKSSLAGGRFGSRAEITQLDNYLIASERRGAERWLGTMGINKPVRLRDTFRTELRMRNIGLIDIGWVSPKDTLLSHLESIP
jgi:hypothetical protein